MPAKNVPEVISCFNCCNALFCKVLEAADKFGLIFSIVHSGTPNKTKKHLREFVAAHCLRYNSIYNLQEKS